MPDIATTALQTCIQQWSAALQADSVSPQPTYALDGKTVSQQEWRDGLLKNIADAQNVVNQRNPTITWSGGCCAGRWGLG